MLYKNNCPIIWIFVLAVYKVRKFKNRASPCVSPIGVKGASYF